MLSEAKHLLLFFQTIRSAQSDIFQLLFGVFIVPGWGLHSIYILTFFLCRRWSRE